ncbi:helix-turn-helix transcriptional regulator [Nonomuraea typhae]|uniref:helix-turn-helix transcriptional regulator n=1 Tax=Nonomuraea typhae TaxID=2603600 RepID=UPI0012FC4FC7|nr:helix-turn-helix transcriptional regulator [Nonomuraea typhae]
MYQETAPRPELAGRVSWLWEQVAEKDGTQLVVPDAAVDLIWGPDGLHVAGPDTGPMPTAMRAGDVYVGVRFHPGAAGLTFGVSLEALRDQRVPVAQLDGPLRELQDGLERRPGIAELTPEAAARRDAVRQAMLKAVVRRWRETPEPDTAAPAIATALRAGRSVGEVAWDLGFSERQLHRRSMASFGYSPKILQRIVRFQRALRLARAGRPLAEVAAESGYADQAHLANDVKRLSGVTMSVLIR